MNHRLNELHLQRGRLLERIATQRAALSYEVQPVHAALDKADRLLDRVHAVTNYVKRHPSVTALAVAALFVLKGKRIWRWSSRIFSVWRTWRALRDELLLFGLRARS